MICRDKRREPLHIGYLNVICVFCMILLSGFFSTPVIAEDASQENKESTSKNAFEVSPIEYRVNLSSMQILDNVVTIKNPSDSTLTISLSAAPLSSDAETEVDNYSKETAYTTISQWITFADQNGEYQNNVVYEIMPSESKDIAFRITAPENTPNGGQYAAILAVSEPTMETESLINTVTRIAIPIYADMEGEVVRKAIIDNVGAESFAIGNKVKAYATFENAGNIEFNGSMHLSITSIFGKEILKKNTFATVLPESKKTVSIEWDKMPLMGLFHMHYIARAYDEVYEESTLVFVMAPSIFVLALVLLIAAIISVVYLIKIYHSGRKIALR